MRIGGLSKPVVVGLLVLGTALAAALTSTADARGGTGPAASYVGPVGRPNIVLIVTDDMREDELRFMPNVRRLLVARGTTYTGAISPAPVCCPARAELLTGQYGHNNGVRNNSGPWGGYQALQEKDNTIAAWLRAAGYRTSHHGKYLNGYERVWSAREPGWTRWDTQVAGMYSYDQRAVFADGDRVTGRYITDIMTARSNAAISQFAKSGAPFFTVINHVAPHGALRPSGWTPPVAQRQHRRRYVDLKPPSYGEPSFQEAKVSDLPPDLRHAPVSTRNLRVLSRARARALRSADDAVAATIRRLADLRQLDNTYVVFTSDNGYLLGEHRLKGKNLPFDEAFDVPLVVRGPGVPAGVRVGEPVTLVDLPATFLDWAGGVEPGRALDGLSLTRLKGARDTLLVQVGDSVADSTPGWRYRGVTTRRYLYATHAGNPGTGILFDRFRDPHALVNRLEDPDYAEVRAELQLRLDELLACAGPDACNRLFGPLPEPA